MPNLGIRSKLFLVSFGIIAATMLSVDAFLTPALDRQLTDRIAHDLLVRARLAAGRAGAEPAAGDDLPRWDAVADELGGLADERVTLVRADGRVMGDSDVELGRLPTLENHGSRPEIVDALRTGRGSGSSLSTTGEQRLLYVAVPFGRDGAGRPFGTARLAMPLTEVDAAIGHLRQVLAGGSVLALVLALIMSSGAAHFMSRAVRHHTAVARQMAEGDLAMRTLIEGGDELADLGRALNHMAGSLSTTLEELRGERDLLGRVLEGMQEGVLMVDAAGRVVMVNAALRGMLLLAPNVGGKAPIEVVRNAELQALLDRAGSAGAPTSGEIEVGGLKPRRLLVHAAPLTGDPGALVAVFVDVTEIRRLETLRRDFVANASHELRTPVSAVRSAAETLRAGALSDPAIAGRFVEIIDRNAERLHRLVDDLLDLSRIESREVRPDIESVVVAPMAERIVGLFRESADGRRVTLGLEVPKGLAVRADRGALEQILVNLVDNAVKYSGEGARVTLAAEPEADGVRIVVRDTGAGIEARHLPRLFERFYRVDPGRSREMGGTGLGLSIVKHLTESMGGSVNAASVPGHGSTFTVSLPLP